MERYFDKFPTISYSNTIARDITRRVVLSSEFKNNLDLYYPVEIESGFRPDQLAEAYYEDEGLDWLIYLNNNIIDPYYEWYISENNFNDFIVKKYGSIANAQSRIKYYRNNWDTDGIEITPDIYNNTIDTAWRKYYEPIFGAKDAIIAYKRKAEDWTYNTNKILQYTISLANSEVTFTNNELVDIKYSGEIVGGGTVIASNSSVLIIYHVSGNTSANTTATKTIIGATSSANGTANAVTTLSENITNSEAVFWSNVSYYDWELEKYESRKHIQVIDADASFAVVEEIRQKLKE